VNFEESEIPVTSTGEGTLKFGSQLESITPTEKPKIYITIDSKGSEFVNIRSQPSTASEIVGQAEHDDEYELMEKERGWYKVYLEEESLGWIFGEYIRDKNQ
jgi:uncharacterized protein YgiM (DUF1202 family)